MTGVSYLESSPRLRSESTPLAQIVLAVLTSLYALLTMQTAGFLAYADVDTHRAFSANGAVYDGQGNRITGLAALWHTYSALGWGVLALALLIGVASMWRAIGSRRTPAAWLLLATVGALASSFWLLNADRIQL
jgi:hypothetical protein